MSEPQDDGDITIKQPPPRGDPPADNSPPVLPEESIGPNPFAGATDGGGASWYRPGTKLPVFVAPTVPERLERLNTITSPLQPFACWRLDDPRFDFDSSFVKPEAAPEFTQLAELMRRAGECHATLFGHADPTGEDGYNKRLGAARAMAVYGVLTRDAALWKRLYDNPPAGKEWGTSKIQVMLGALGLYQGPIDGIFGSGSTKALRVFQASRGLPESGWPDAATREQLYLAYMDVLCRDAAGQPFSLARENFLGGGRDPEGKGAYQSCGEFNPIRVFSQAEQAHFAQWAHREERNAEYAPNRRVVLYLFRKGLELLPEQWPCPRALEGVAGCRAFFWPDGEQRRSPQQERREYTRTKDTFACGWYEQIAHRSPCESPRRQLKVTLFSHGKRLMPNAPYRLWLGSSPGAAPPDRVGTANAAGQVFESNVLTASTAFIEWAPAGTEEQFAKARFPYHAVIRLNLDEGSPQEQAARRLANLGYHLHSESFEEQLGAFQDDYELTATGATRGVLDDTTQATLRRVHEDGVPRPGA